MDLVLTAHAQTVITERGIRREWIESAVNFPESELPDRSDPTLIHAIRTVPEFGNRKLRVIVDKTTKPFRVVTAYFDRTLRDLEK
jgi:hypothetical protein